MTRIINSTAVEMKNDGHMQQLRTLDVAFKFKSEDVSAGRLTLESADLSDLFQLWSEHDKRKDPFLRFVGLPLTAICYTEEDAQLVGSTVV